MIKRGDASSYLWIRAVPRIILYCGALLRTQLQLTLVLNIASNMYSVGAVEALSGSGMGLTWLTLRLSVTKGSSVIRALIILIVGTLVATAAATPVIYELIGVIAGSNPWPFSRVFNRVAMLFALVFIVILRRHFDLQQVRTALTAETRRQALGHVALGFGLTILSVSVAVPVLIFVTGDLIWDPPSTGEIVYRIVKTFFAALLIGVIEESFFRVLLLNSTRRSMPLVCAVLLVSFIYAFVHFITPIKTWSYEAFHFEAGFVYLGNVLLQFFDPSVPPALFGLFLVGIVLSIAILRTGSLYLCIGMHAGWVLCVKLIRTFGDFAPALELSGGRVSQYFLVSTQPAWISIVVVGLCVYALSRGLKYNKQVSASI